AGEVAAQLAVAIAPRLARRGRLHVHLPSAERLCARLDAGGQTEAVQHAVRREAIHVAAIPLRRFEERARQQAHLRQWKWLDLRRDIFARELEEIFERRDLVHRALAPLWIRHAGGLLRSLLLRGERSGSRYHGGKRSAAEIFLVHDPPRCWNRLQYATD